MGGTWKIVREGNGPGQLRLIHENARTGKVFECGRLSPVISDEMVIDWILMNAPSLTHGDYFQLSNGQQLRFFQGPANA